MLHLVFIFLALGLGLLQALIGGARLVYALPAYAVLAIAGIAALGAQPATEREGPRISCVLATLLFAAYVCIRAWLSPIDYLARGDFFMALAALLVYFLAASHLTGAKERIAVLGVLVVYAFIHVVVGAVQFRQGDDYMLLPWIFRPPQYYWRASGLFVSPNHAAAMFEMIAMLALGVCAWGRSSAATRLLAAYGALICFVGIAITGSRLAYVTTIFGLIVMTLLSLWIIRKFFPDRFVLLSVSTAMLVVLLVLVGLFFMNRSQQLISNFSEKDRQQGLRPLLQEAAARQRALSPAFGTGSGTTLFFSRQFRSECVQGDPVHAGSDYGEFLAEYGYVGGVLCAVFVAAHVFSGLAGMFLMIREKRRTKRVKQSTELSIVVGALAAAATLLAHGFTDVSLHLPANALLFAFLFGILANPGDQISRRLQPARFSNRWSRFGAPALGIVLLAWCVPRARAEYHSELARIALRDRQYAEARGAAEQALAHGKKNPDLCYYLGEAHHYLGLEDADAETRFLHYSAAADAFARGLALFPQDTRLLLKMGRTLDNLGRFEEAAQFFDRAIRADPNFARVYACYGLHYQMQGLLGRARELYVRAGKLGETEISSVGLRELERLRDRPLRRRLVNDGLSEFITEPEMVKPP